MNDTERVHDPIPHDDPRPATDTALADLTLEPPRYSLTVDGPDGDERYYVCAWTKVGEGVQVDLVSIAGSAASAYDDLIRLRRGEDLPHDRRKHYQRAIQEKGASL